jgi:outer membrane protein, multidrug efflux system
MMPRLSVYLLLCAASVTLASCSIGRDYNAPELPKLSEDVLQETNEGRFKAVEPVKNWWSTLEDKQLTSLVEKALANNFDIQVAIARVEEARAMVSGTEYDRFPTVTASSNAAMQRLSNEGILGRVADRTVKTYEAGFDASWELDVFGRVNQGIEAERTRLEAREADLQGVYVTIAAEAVRTYIELRGAQHRLDVAERNAQNQQKTYALIENLAQSGKSNDLDIARAQSQLDQTLSQIPTREAEVNAAINRLGVLTGQTPDALRSELKESKPLPKIPQNILVGDAGALLKRRPDVRAAERELAVTIADYNVNVADLYPRIALQGNIGFLATAFSNLATGGALTYLLAPALSWEAFNLGRVEARINAADARTRARLAQFQKTVLSALEEVDTAMVNFSREEQRRYRLARSAEASAKAARLARQRYESGIDSFLDLLDAERRQLEAEDLLAGSDIQTALNVIAVYKALGGGWEMATTPSITFNQPR